MGLLAGAAFVAMACGSSSFSTSDGGDAGYPDAAYDYDGFYGTDAGSYPEVGGFVDANEGDVGADDAGSDAEVDDTGAGEGGEPDVGVPDDSGVDSGSLCTMSSDCMAPPEDDPDCVTVTCSGGTCVVSYPPSGTTCSIPTRGKCDGMGTCEAAGS
jgi:hypothetical protein